LSVLGTLLRSGELTLGELAAIERVKPPSITRTVNCLVEAGLVTRRPHATDGRQVLVELTDEARNVLDEDRRRRDLWLARRLDELGPADRELLRRVAPLLDLLAGS
jgi:DNA-binding MarR family transcriptional regulator